MLAESLNVRGSVGHLSALGDRPLAWPQGLDQQVENKEPRIHGEQWKRFVAEKRSRGKLATGLGAQGFDNKITELYAAKKIYGKNLVTEAAGA